METIISMWQLAGEEKEKWDSMSAMMKERSKVEIVTIEQFCSILLECNLMHIDQLYLKRAGKLFDYNNYAIPQEYIWHARKVAGQGEMV